MRRLQIDSTTEHRTRDVSAAIIDETNLFVSIASKFLSLVQIFQTGNKNNKKIMKMKSSLDIYIYPLITFI